MRPFLPLTSWRTATSWRDAVAAGLRHPGTDCRIDGGNRIEIVVVGSPDEIAGVWPDLRERLQDVGAEAAIEVVVLEVGRDAKAVRDGALPDGCLGRFRVGRVYANGTLTEVEEVGLAARFLGLSSHLFRFAQDQRPHGLVTVGAVLGWLPTIPLGLALARFLEEMLAAELLRREACPPRRLSPLFRPATLGKLAATLRSELEREAAVLVSRLNSTYRRAPVRELADDAHPGEAAALHAAATWCGQAFSTMTQELCKTSHEMAALPTARAMVEQAIRQLSEAGQALRIQERLLAARRERAAREAKAQDERRLRTRNSCILWRPFVSWWARQRTRRRLREFGRARAAGLLVRYQAVAVERLRAEMESLSRRLTHLLDQAPSRGKDLDDLLRPDHPSLLALQDVAALRGHLKVLAESLPRQRGVPAVWERALSGIYGENGAEETAWLAVRAAAEKVAAAIDRAAEPLSHSCRALLPRFRPATLRNQLARAARPSDAGEPGSAWTEQIVFLNEGRSEGGTGVGAVCFRWQS
jgi:hypothetical protein